MISAKMIQPNGTVKACEEAEEQCRTVSRYLKLGIDRITEQDEPTETEREKILREMKLSTL